MDDIPQTEPSEIPSWAKHNLHQKIKKRTQEPSSDWLDELLDEVYQDKNTLGDFPVDRLIFKQVIQSKIKNAMTNARKETDPVLRCVAYERELKTLLKGENDARKTKHS